MCCLLVCASARAENYAVFFAGGNTLDDNWEIYYDEVLRHYKHVVNRWNYRPENVWVIFADGTSLLKDLTMWASPNENSDWTYVQLKGSTVRAATYDNTRDILTGLQDLGPGDMFYFWSYDHGYGDKDEPSHHDEEGFSGWNQYENNNIADDVFAGWVNPIGAGRHAYVLGQCYSGGVLEELQMINLPPGHQRFGCASATHQEPAQSSEVYEGFNDAWCDGIENEDLTFTQHLYVYAYEDCDLAPSEGPNADYWWGLHHPWMVGDNLFLPVSLWKGSGAGGSSTDWGNASNWSYWNDGGSVRVAFESAGQAVIDEQLTFGGFLTLNWDEQLGGAANVIINAGADFYCQTADIGKAGTESNPSWGSLVQNGGNAHFNQELVLGDKPYSRGYYTLTGGDVYVHGGQGNDGMMVVGDSGYGHVAQYGGNAYLTHVPLYLGRESDGNGWYELLGGQIQVSDVYVGYEGTGNFHQASGAHNISGALEIGHADGSVGTYTQSGGTLAAQSIQIGWEDGSQGTFSMSGGTLDADNILLGFEAGSQANFSVRSSGDPAIVSVENAISVGSHLGTGTFLVQDGAWVIAGTIEVGDYGNGSFFQGGGTVQADAEIIGKFGGDDQNALYEHSGGDNIVGVNLFVGGSGSATAGPGRPPIGRYNLSGNGVLDVGGFLTIGDYGTGEFTHSESTVSVEGGLVLGSDGGTGTYTMPDSASTNPALTVAGHAFVGSAGVGTFSQYNGTHTVGLNLYVGKDADADGTYELQNDAVLSVGGDVYVGFLGHGEVHQTGGAHVVAGNLDVGYAAGSDGTYIMDGGTLNVHNGIIRVGRLGDTGDFTLNGGTVIADTFQIGNFGTFGGSGDGTLRVNHLTGLSQDATVHGSLQLGHNGGMGTGALNLTFNRKLEVIGDLTVAHSVDAEFTVLSAEVIAADVYAGIDFGVHGTVSLTAGTLTADNLYLGAFGTAAFDQNGGTTNLAGDLVVAGGFSPDASYTLRSSSATLEAGSEIVGGAGFGTFAHDKGTNTVSGTLTLGSGPTGDGTYHLSDGTVEAATLIVGGSGTGHFTQGDGSGNTVNATTVRLGGNADGQGTYELWGGQLQCTSLIVGDAGTGTFFQSSDLTATDFIVISSQVGSHGTYNLDSGDLSANLLRAGGGSGTDGTFNWNYGTLSVPTVQVWRGGTFNVSDYWAFGGAIEVTGGLLNMNGGSASLRLDAPGDGATMTITGGAVNSWNQVVGDTQKATVTHSGGSNTVSSLLLGNDPGAEGTYLFSGGSLVSTHTDVGIMGTGTFTQSSGTFDAGETLNVGYSAGSGVYNLQNGSVETYDLKIGIFGSGHFNWTGGVLLASDVEVGPGGTMEVGVIWARNGTLAIHGGSVNATGLGTAICLGTGGTGDEGGSGVIEITAGTLDADTLCVGYNGTGTVTQTGGTVTGNLLWIGRQGPGDYQYEGGDLTMNNYLVRSGGTLTVMSDWTCSGMLAVQGGAAHFVEGSLTVEGPGDAAQAMIFGGSLAATDLNIGILQPGRLAITDASANVTVSNLLRLGPSSALSAVPGAGVIMTGSDFRNESTDAAALAGLRNMEMTFQGGPMVLDSFEVAGKDVGATMDGCADNFALGGLLLGDYPEGRVRLDDAFDNQPGWAGTEALYVHRLTVMGGSELNLNGRNLYYLASAIDPDALIDENGGALIPISIPGAAAEMLGVPEPHDVEVTLSQSGDTDRGTFGMAVPGADGEMRALSCVVEVDAGDLEDALEDSGANYFSLVIYYDEQELDVLDIVEDTLRPYWWDGMAWVLGGTTTGGEEGEGVFAGFDTSPGDYSLGYCGLHTGADYLWVNLNHASDYGAGGLAVTVLPQPGDTNGDDIVDSLDYDNLIAQFGGVPGVESADFNGDGFVDLEDFAILRGNFGFGVSSPDAEFGATTPEPATLMVLALGGLAVLRKRRKQ